MPTLFIGGAKTKGLLPKVLHALAAHVPEFEDRDDPEHDASDVRAGAAGIFRNRAGISGGLNMQTLRVNGYDMAYLEVGQGHPLVCVHGTLGDFRTWYAVLGPLSKKHRVISVSLRHFFPEHWDGVGDDYRMAQHVADIIAFIEQINPRPVDLMGHSRGGHIAFRVAQQRPDLLRKVVLAEPGGDLDTTLDPAIVPGAPSALAARIACSRSRRSGPATSKARCRISSTASTAKAAWRRLPAAAKQQLRDNITTLLGQAA